MLVIRPDNASIAESARRNARSMRSSLTSSRGLRKWLSLNAEYAKIWPNITVKKAPPPDLKEWEGKPDKLQILLTEVPARVIEAETRSKTSTRHLRRAIGSEPKNTHCEADPAKDHELLRAPKDRSIRRVAGLHRASLSRTG